MIHINQTSNDMPIHITSSTKSTKVQHKTKDELRTLIEQELERQGPDADLNFIDTSLITDMSALFGGFNRLHIKFYIRNIKIDQWDVNNVTNMANMFNLCTHFNCDLSRWDVSNVNDMDYMFSHCYEFRCDLSSWKPNLRKLNSTVFGSCTLMTDELKPQI